MSKSKMIRAYHVKGCKVDAKTIFTGYVLRIDEEPIIESIKRKVGVKNLLCEMTNEGFDYDYVDILTVPLRELTLGDYFIISGDFQYLN